MRGKDIPVNEDSNVGSKRTGLLNKDLSEADKGKSDKEDADQVDTDKKEADQGGIIVEQGITVSEQVLLDQDGIKITLKGFDPNGDAFGPTLKVLVENNRNEPITVQTINTVINGVMQVTYLFCDVPSGERVNDEIRMMQTDLDKAGIKIIKDIELEFHIRNTDTWDIILNSEPIYITTTADPSYVQKYDDSGFLALEEKGIKIVIKKDNTEDYLGSMYVNLYVENNTDEDIFIQAKDVSVNGVKIDPWFSSYVLAGKKAYDSMQFFRSDLEENGIKAIKEIELVFHIINGNTYKTILDSDVIYVNFEEQ